MIFFKKAIFFLFLSVIFCLISCQKEQNKNIDQAIEAIPVNSTMVTAFDLPAIMEKANFDAVKKMDFYQFLIEKANEESDILATVLSNPENAGIDLTKNAYLSIELNENNPEEIYMGIIFNLTSREDFQGFAQSFRNSKIGKRKNYQIAVLNESNLLAWNDKVGVLAFGEGISETEEVVDAFFAPNTEASLSNNENLTNLLSEKHDVISWLTSNTLAKNKAAKLLLVMANIKPEALNDNFVHAYMDFEDGKVGAKVNYFFQEELVRDVRLLFKDHVMTDFSPYIPAQNLNGYFSVALDFEGLDQSLSKRPQVKTFANFFLKRYGLSIQKIQDVLDGDLILASYTGNINNRTEGLLATKINNQKQLELLLRLAEENELVTKTGNGRYLFSPQLNKLVISTFGNFIGGSEDIQLMIKDDIAFFSDNISLLNQIESGSLSPTNQLPKNVKTMIYQNSFALFLDFNSLKRLGVILGANSLDVMKGSSNGKGADFQLTMKEKDSNSLYTIFKIINEEFLKNKEKKQPVSEGKS